MESLPQGLKEIIGQCSAIAQAQGVKAYLVGGFVRDLILGVNNLDLDVVIEGDGIKFAEALAVSSSAKLTRHRRFATATVILGHNLKIDVATAREEWYPHPACLPQVSPGTVRDDLKRRDFSINAMAISINPENYASLIDFFNGMDDLRHKRVRVLHNLSFIDDPTRILRAVRFEKRYGFKIDTATLRLLKEAVRLKMLQKVQPQRLRDELILILKEDRPVKQIKRIQQLAGLSFIHPRLELTESRLRFLKSGGRQIRWFNQACLQRRHLDNWLIYLIALLDELALNDIKTVFKIFVFRRGEEIRAISYKKLTKAFIRRMNKKNLRPSQIFHLLDHLSYEVILLIRAKYGGDNLRKHIADFLCAYNFTRINITGHDLHDLGIKPGPGYQKMLRKVFNAKLDGRLHSKADETDFVKKMISKKEKVKR